MYCCYYYNNPVVKVMGRDRNYRHLARGNSLHFYYSPLLATNFPFPTHINLAWQAIRNKVSIRSCSPLHGQRCTQQPAVQHVGVVTCREMAYSSWSPDLSPELNFRSTGRRMGSLGELHLEQKSNGIRLFRGGHSQRALSQVFLSLKSC